MELFENVLKLEFKEKYKEYCDSIRNNIVSAIYDIEFLKNIEQYTVRLKVLESTSSKLLNYIILLFWQDLILKTSKILEKKVKIQNLYIDLIATLSRMLFKIYK